MTSRSLQFKCHSIIICSGWKGLEDDKVSLMKIYNAIRRHASLVWTTNPKCKLKSLPHYCAHILFFFPMSLLLTVSTILVSLAALDPELGNIWIWNTLYSMCIYNTHWPKSGKNMVHYTPVLRRVSQINSYLFIICGQKANKKNCFSYSIKILSL